MKFFARAAAFAGAAKASSEGSAMVAKALRRKSRRSTLEWWMEEGRAVMAEIKAHDHSFPVPIAKTLLAAVYRCGGEVYLCSPAKVGFIRTPGESGSACSWNESCGA